jgi:2-phosphosulfolactate phosphatase
VKGRYAKNVLIAGFTNLSTVVECLKELGSDFIIICSGQDNRFCMEDVVCAGKVINTLAEKTDVEIVTDDAGFAAMTLDNSLGKNILKMLKNSQHGRYLTEIGFGEDVKACAGIDTSPLLPLLSTNIIRAAKGKQ